MERPVRIYASALDAMRGHALACSPKECCGLLAGFEDAIGYVLPLPNALDSERAFFADPAELIAALRRLRSQGLKHLGIYHSHPSSENFPSRRDVEMAFYPHCAHFIVSPHAPLERQVRAFSIVDGSVTELAIELYRPSESSASSVTGHGFSRATDEQSKVSALAADQRLKPHHGRSIAARLKPCPDTMRSRT